MSFRLLILFTCVLAALSLKTGSGDSKDMINVLIFNCGSSSLSCQIYEFNKNNPKQPPRSIFSAKGHRVSTKSTEKPYIEYHLKNSDGTTKDLVEEYDSLTHGIAANKMIRFLHKEKRVIHYVGHRFVHPGNLFSQSVSLTNNPEAYEKLKSCEKLAPIHNPAAVSVIDECSAYYGKEPGVETVHQFVTFDNSFHAKLKPEFYNFAIDKNIAEKYGFRKIGFHGLSYQYVSESLERHLGTKKTGKIVVCHIGTGGASCAGMEDGVSVDVTMQYSSISGLVMSTRSGDIDQSIVISLFRDLKMKPEEVENFLAKKCGNVGLTRGVSSDLRDIYAIGIDKTGTFTDAQREDCRVAFGVYVNRLVGKIGELAAKMGGFDALCFTDDLGFNMWQLRDAVCERLKFLGISIDKEVNKATAKGKGQLAKSDIAEIQDKTSKNKIYVIKNDEEIVIAREAIKFFK